MDFFGLPHGRPVAYFSALTVVQEGRGFNAYFPMPFRDRIRIELTNGNTRPTVLYYQVDYTLEPSIPDDAGYLHVAVPAGEPDDHAARLRHRGGVAWARAGSSAARSASVTIDACNWYGEGEMKVYRDGDTRATRQSAAPASRTTLGPRGAWRRTPHSTPVSRSTCGRRPARQPGVREFLPLACADPIVFEREMKVTIQQIGYMSFGEGQEAEFEAYDRTNPAAGAGWDRNTRRAPSRAASRSAWTTSARRRSSTAPSRSRCLAWTSRRRWRTSAGATGNSRTRSSGLWGWSGGRRKAALPNRARDTTLSQQSLRRGS